MKNNIRIIVILCLISSLARFVLDSYLPSLPAIGSDFGISSEGTQFTLTVYLLGFSISQLIYGPLSDHYGRRKIILIGLTIFVLGNIICAISTSHFILLFARLLAGVGAGSCGVLNRAIASDCFKGAEFSKAWSYNTTTLVVTLCIAPVIGGYIQESLGWRANFVCASIYVFIVFGLILYFLPETNQNLISKHLNQPFLNLKAVLRNYYSIFLNLSFLYGALCYSLAFSGLIAYFQVSPLLLIYHLGLTPSQFGWCSLLIAFTYFLGGLFVNRYVMKFGTQYLLKIGALLLILGGVLMVVINMLQIKNLLGILLPAAIYVIGARIVIPNAISISMQTVHHLSGSSSALLGCLQMLSASFVSFSISKFSDSTSLPLAIALTCLGLLTLLFYKRGSLLNQI